MAKRKFYFSIWSFSYTIYKKGRNKLLHKSRFNFLTTKNIPSNLLNLNWRKSDYLWYRWKYYYGRRLSIKKDTVRAIILTEDEKSVCLLYRRKKEHGEIKTYYAFPGGKIKENETIEEALIREIKEELSVDITILGYLGKNVTEKGIDYHYHVKIINNNFLLAKKNTEDNYYEIRIVKLTDLNKEGITILPVNISYIETSLKKDYKTF